MGGFPTAADFKAMHPGDFLAFLGTDAQKWAKAFRVLHPDSGLDEGMMLGWFSNAMMAMHDELRGNPWLNGDHAQWLIDRQALATPEGEK